MISSTRSCPSSPTLSVSSGSTAAIMAFGADGNQSNLRLAAFETLMELIKNSPKDCYPVVQNTTLLMLKKLKQLLDMETHAASVNDKLIDLQAPLYATLQSVVRKMQPGDAPKVVDPMMLLQIMDRSAGRASNVIEEALVVVAIALKGDFVCYDVLRPHLLRGLATADETAVVIAAVGVVTELCSMPPLSLGEVGGRTDSGGGDPGGASNGPFGGPTLPRHPIWPEGMNTGRNEDAVWRKSSINYRLINSH